MISKGYEQCAMGGKMVLFVYRYCGQCDCFYYPLSENRKNVTDVYANGRKVESGADIIEEAKHMDALGSSITSGEPQEALDKARRYISLLKDEFGENHHIHLYTGITDDRENMCRLAEAGLDKIRFHPSLELWGNMHGTKRGDILYIAHEGGLTPAFEVPGTRAESEFLGSLDEGAAEFCNVNRFKISDGNYRRMQEEGYELQGGHMSTVDGSKEAILDEMGDHEHVYFCTSAFKDAAQYRSHLKHMAHNLRRPFDEVTDDSTPVYGKTYMPAGRFIELGVLDESYSIKSNHAKVMRWLLEEMIGDGDVDDSKIVERYPTYDGTVVERTSLA